MNRKRILFLIMYVLTVFSSFAQVGEGADDCTYSKEVIVPFNYSPRPEIKVKPILDQTVFYGHRDQFSYWYKIIVKENALLNFKVSALNDSDTYAVFVYQYNQPDFCNKLFYHKITHVKPTFFSDKNSQENPYDLSLKSFQAIKENTYYISVLNTSLHNCGHNLRLIYGLDTLKVRAIHLPCERDITSFSVKASDLKNTPQKKDTVAAKIILPAPLPVDSVKVNTLVCYVKDGKKNIALKIKPRISDASSGDEIEAESPDEGEWRATVQKGKQCRIKCQAIGYKNVEQNIEISKAITSVDILMEPLKVGDNFVLKSIYFYPNTYALKKESAPDLQKLLNYLAENENVAIEIQGHTNGDHRVAKNKAYGSLSEEWNFQGSAKELSQKRAEAIKTFLSNNGIAQERLSPKGYGGKKPIIKDPQDNDEGQMNIRVEIVILKS